jgi:hypothetical protein
VRCTDESTHGDGGDGIRCSLSIPWAHRRRRYVYQVSCKDDRYTPTEAHPLCPLVVDPSGVYIRGDGDGALHRTAPHGCMHGCTGCDPAPTDRPTVCDPAPYCALVLWSRAVCPCGVLRVHSLASLMMLTIARAHWLRAAAAAAVCVRGRGVRHQGCFCAASRQGRMTLTRMRRLWRWTTIGSTTRSGPVRVTACTDVYGCTAVHCCCLFWAHQ